MLSSSVDKVTTGTYNFEYVILDIAFVGELSKAAGLSPCAAVTSLFSMLEITQFADQVEIKDNFTINEWDI